MWNDSKVEFAAAFEVEAEDAFERNDGEDSAVFPSILEYATEFSAVIGVIVPLEWSD